MPGKLESNRGCLFIFWPILCPLSCLSQVFERLRNESPTLLSKLHIIEGDLLQAGLGIKATDRDLLEKEVSVVFNGAASLKLEAELKENVAANTKGTQQLLDLCINMKKLVVGFVCWSLKTRSSINILILILLSRSFWISFVIWNKYYLHSSQRPWFSPGTDA